MLYHREKPPLEASQGGSSGRDRTVPSPEREGVQDQGSCGELEIFQSSDKV